MSLNVRFSVLLMLDKSILFLLHFVLGWVMNVVVFMKFKTLHFPVARSDH